MMDLGKKLSELRRENGISQEKLAEMVGVSRQAVTKWENGKTFPDTENLIRLAEIFGVSLDELCMGEIPKKPAAKVHPGGHIFALLSIIIAAAYCVIGGITGDFDGGFLIMLLILVFPMHVFLHLIFCVMIKSGEFSMLAGYDPNVKYDTEGMKRYLSGLDFLLGMTSTSYILIMSATKLIAPQFEVMPLLLCGYILSFVSGIFFMGYKFGDQIYADPNEAKKAKRGMPSAVILVMEILLSAGIFILVFEMKGYENNTAEPLPMLGLMFLSITLSLAGYLIEGQRLKKADEHADLFGKPFIVLNFLALICMMLMAFI